MKKLFGVLALSVMFGLSTSAYSGDNNNNEKKSKTDDCKAVTELALEATLDHDERGDSELKGKLFNSGSEEYEDIMIRVDFYNDLQEVISSQTFKVTEDIGPGNTEDFKFEFTAPEGTAHATWAVDCAEEE